MLFTKYKDWIYSLHHWWNNESFSLYISREVFTINHNLIIVQYAREIPYQLEKMNNYSSDPSIKLQWIYRIKVFTYNSQYLIFQIIRIRLESYHVNQIFLWIISTLYNVLVLAKNNEAIPRGNNAWIKLFEPPTIVYCIRFIIKGHKSL